MAPVRATWVPPQAERSNAGTSTSRSAPSRAGSLRSGSAFASSAEAKRTATSRSSHTTRLASSTARSTWVGGNVAARSIVDDSLPRWKLTVAASHARTSAADSTCCPVCCCM